MKNTLGMHNLSLQKMTWTLSCFIDVRFENNLLGKIPTFPFQKYGQVKQRSFGIKVSEAILLREVNILLKC
jgi:hypothetical protein